MQIYLSLFSSFQVTVLSRYKPHKRYLSRMEQFKTFLWYKLEIRSLIFSFNWSFSLILTLKKKQKNLTAGQDHFRICLRGGIKFYGLVKRPWKMRFLMEMLAEFLLLGWDGNPIKKKKQQPRNPREGGGGWSPIQMEACFLAGWLGYEAGN